MDRRFPRAVVNLPVSLFLEGSIEIKCTAINLGLGGVFIEVIPSDNPEKFDRDEAIQLKMDFPKIGEMSLWGKISRFEKGLAVQFGKINEGDQIKLWQYLIEILEDSGCPYCGKEIFQGNEDCEKCGWNLDFTSNNYLKYMKREGLIRLLVHDIHQTSDEQLHQIAEILEPNLSKQEVVNRLEETEDFVGTCDQIKQVFAQIRRVAQTELPVIILGETGTGKELTARAIHERSVRNNMPFVPINCAAIPETLLEAEFFGYEKGTYTGAHTSKGGKIEYADGGTLFLDEMVELSTNLQSKLLRFLDDHIIERIGSRESKKIDVRLITATNQDLESALANGSLRPDFYHRLKVFTIDLTPLRDRGEDKSLLSNYFLKKFSREMEIPAKGFTKNAIDAINAYSWPGNVREMINKIRRALVMNHGGTISTEDLELDGSETSRLQPLEEMRKKVERDLIVEALAKSNFNIARTARTLNISRPHLYSLIKKYNIERNKPN